jgi:hypothetical protein
MHKLNVARGWTAAGILLPLLVVALYAYLSTDTVIRLRPVPPPEFFDVEPDWSAERRATEERLAQAYWERARNVLRGRYTFGSVLPETPPEEFKVEVQDISKTLANSPEVRSRYWRNLRRVWLLPKSWEKHYQWNPKWLFNNR